VDEPVMMVSGAGTKHYFHLNHLYSVAAMTNSVGAVVERYRYDAYGKRTVTNAAGTIVLGQSAVANQIGFQGRPIDAETGLYYSRTRSYSPASGRFNNRMPWQRIGDIYLSNWSSLAIDAEWKPLVRRSMNSQTPYHQGRANLYVFAANAPSIYLEPYSTIGGNCYNWAMGDFFGREPGDASNPGDYAYEKGTIKDPYNPLPNNSCENLLANIKADAAAQGKKILSPDADGKCPCDYYLVQPMVSDKPYWKDYHFKREEPDGSWTEKHGVGGGVADTAPAPYGWGFRPTYVPCPMICVPVGGITTGGSTQ